MKPSTHRRSKPKTITPLDRNGSRIPSNRSIARRRMLTASAAAVLILGAGMTPATAATGWTTTTGIAPGRSGQAAALLTDGRVLLVGGSTASAGQFAPLRQSQLYDPSTGRWTVTKPPLEARTNAAAAAMPDGRVLLAGGQGAGSLRSAEIYDPKRGSWSATAPMGTARAKPVAVLLASGSVLVIGQPAGIPRGVVPTAEIFDRRSMRWSATGPMGVPASTGAGGSGAVLLPSGDVLTNFGMYGAATGINVGPRLYSPLTNSWRQLPAPPVPLGGEPQMALLPDGHVLFVGGATTALQPTGSAVVTAVNAVAELNPASGSWTVRADRARVSAADGSVLTTLLDGRVLSSGGSTNADTDQIYDPTTRTWTTVPGSNRSSHSATVLATGRVLAAGGVADADATKFLGSAALFAS